MISHVVDSQHVLREFGDLASAVKVQRLPLRLDMLQGATN
jgi:hypothetical protein